MERANESTTVQAGEYITLSFDGVYENGPCTLGVWIFASYADTSDILLNGVPVVGSPNTAGGSDFYPCLAPGIQVLHDGYVTTNYHHDVRFRINECAPTDCLKSYGGDGYRGPDSL